MLQMPTLFSAAYDKLQKKIRSILEEHAAIESTDEVQLTELAQLMFDLR